MTYLHNSTSLFHLYVCFPLTGLAWLALQEAERGVERAAAARDEILAQLATLRGIQAKLVALEAKFEERTAAAAAQAQAELQ